MLRTGLYNTIGMVARVGVSLLAVPLLIRFIGLEEYGLWALVSAAVGLVGLAEAGLAVSTTFFVSRDLANNDTAAISQTLTVTVGAMLVMATSAALILGLGGATLAGFFPALKEPQHGVAVQAMQIGGVIVWGQLLQQVFIGVEQAYQRYGTINTVNTIQAALTSLGLVGVAALGGRSVALMRWQAIMSLGALAIHVSVVGRLLRHVTLRPSWSTGRARAIARYSVLTWMTSLGSALFSQVDRLIVGGGLGTGALGVYAAITTITAKINSFSAVPVQPLLPVLSALAAKRNTDQPVLRKHVQQALQLNALIALGIGAALFVLAPLVMRVMVPSAATGEYVLAFRLATVIYTLYSLNATGYFVLFGVNAVSTCMAIQLASATLSLLMIAVAQRSFGLLGAIVGNAGYLGVWLLTFFGMKRLGISVRSWMAWLGFPVMWFLVVTLLSIVLPGQIIFRAFILTLAIGVLLSWFIVAQRISISSLFQRPATK